MADSLTLTLVTGETITVAAGATLVIGWSAEKGDRGAGAVHATETVVHVDGESGALTLTGGVYRRPIRTVHGDCRRLMAVTANGKTSRQIRGIL